jgi:hypothetical protein
MNAAAWDEGERLVSVARRPVSERLEQPSTTFRARGCGAPDLFQIVNTR